MDLIKTDTALLSVNKRSRHPQVKSDVVSRPWPQCKNVKKHRNAEMKTPSSRRKRPRRVTAGCLLEDPAATPPIHLRRIHAVNSSKEEGSLRKFSNNPLVQLLRARIEEARGAGGDVIRRDDMNLNESEFQTPKAAEMNRDQSNILSRPKDETPVSGARCRVQSLAPQQITGSNFGERL